MRIHHREARRALESITLTASLLAFAVVAGCRSPSLQRYATAIEAAQQDDAESMRLEEDVRRQTRLGRFDDAQQTAYRLKERQLNTPGIAWHSRGLTSLS